MTEWHLIYIGVYLLIGLFLADIFLVHVNREYWLFLLFYPIIILIFLSGLVILWVTVKLYEFEERFL